MKGNVNLHIPTKFLLIRIIFKQQHCPDSNRIGDEGNINFHV